MTSTKIRFALLAALLLASFAAQAQSALEPQQSGSVTYISGGVGTDERDAFKSTARQYNLHINNSAASGELTTDDTLVVRDRAGNDVLTVGEAGPMLYAQLPPGTYTVIATIADRHKEQKVTVGAGKPANVHFVW